MPLTSHSPLVLSLSPPTLILAFILHPFFPDLFLYAPSSATVLSALPMAASSPAPAGEASLVPATLHTAVPDQQSRDDAAALRKQRNEEKKKLRAQNEANRLANLAKKGITTPDAVAKKATKKPTPVAPKPYYQALAAPLIAKLHPSTRACKPKHAEYAHVKLSDEKPEYFVSYDSITLSKRALATTTIADDLSDSTRTSSSSDTLVASENNSRPSLPRFLSRRILAPVSRTGSLVYSIDDVPDYDFLQALIERYGGAAHGGTLDRSWSFFVSRDKDAAILFKVRDKIAVVGGDPLCRVDLFPKILSEFKAYRKLHGWGIAFLGTSDAMMPYAKSKKWVTIRWGTERILNPMTNPVLEEKATKQIIRQNKQLLDADKFGITLDLYDPAAKHDDALQQEINGVYEAWRTERNKACIGSAHTTIYDVSALPSLMLYLYTRDAQGKMNGFAALRRMGERNGYYIDPVIAAPGAHRRIPDLLYFSSMAVLQSMNITYLNLGTEPSAELSFTGLVPQFQAWGSQIYDRLYSTLKLGGKREYYDKFRPDEVQEAAVHMMFATRAPSPRHILAICHVSNIRIRKLVWAKMDIKAAFASRRSKAGVAAAAAAAAANTAAIEAA